MCECTEMLVQRDAMVPHLKSIFDTLFHTVKASPVPDDISFRHAGESKVRLDWSYDSRFNHVT